MPKLLVKQTISGCESPNNLLKAQFAVCFAALSVFAINLSKGFFLSHLEMGWLRSF